MGENVNFAHSQRMQIKAFRELSFYDYQISKHRKKNRMAMNAWGITGKLTCADNASSREK